MIAARWGTMLVAALLVLGAFGAAASDLQSSALRVLVTAVVGLLAPLFWPGIAATPMRTAALIAAWSAAAACLAAIAIRILGNPAQTFSRIFASCVMLMFVLILTHTAAAALEGRWRDPSGNPSSAREMAGRIVTIGLALLGSLPLWLGPMAELFSARNEWIIDAIVGISPLTHLAVASGNDLLRNQWLYQHSNLAALPVSYPGLAELAGSYAAFTLVLALVSLAFLLPRRSIGDASRTRSISEKAQ